MLSDGERKVTDNPAARFQILALSGGGYRGLFTAKVLEALEEHAKKPIGECFDLICGVSVGGIIAMGLGAKKSAKEIADVISGKGKDIFKNKRNFLCRIFKAGYSNKNLEKIVRKMFNERLLSESECRLLIPAVNYTTGKMRAFRTQHYGDFSDIYDLPMWHVAMATSAAPTYFPVWQSPDSEVAYLDGGLAANAPGLLGIHEATYFLDQAKENIHLLSIGTMSHGPRLGNPSKLNKGLRYGAEFFDVMISAQENMADDMLKHILTEQRYHYINSKPTKEEAFHLELDKTEESATRLLERYAHDAAKDFLGNPNFRAILQHTASHYTKK